MGQDNNWKATLNLPRTKFPMRANLPQREPQMLARWDEMDLYHKIIEARSEAPRFTLHDGPPYANGHIHHGHILNKLLKDIVVKYHAMSGYLSEYVPGWDCHGLPIEHEVEKRLGSKAKKMTPVQIRAACRDYAERFVGIQKDGFKRLGVLGDWDNHYTTLDLYYESTVVRELGRLVERGLVYKALRPVHWSFGAKSALADAEVEYGPFEAPSIYVAFRMPEPPAWLAEMAGGKPVDAVIWTTTPWTLPANLAIALNPLYDYLLVDRGDSAIIVAEGLAESVYTASGMSEPTVLGEFKGEQLVGTEDDPLRLVAHHPFIDRESVLLPADYVTLDQGTGCVHTAPGHGQEDYVLGRHHGLGIVSPVDAQGRFTDEVPEWAGLHVFAANPKIVEKLHELGALLNEPGDTVLIERYPYCWRTKKPVIFRSTPQWFVAVDLENVREKSLEAVQNTKWVPTWGEDRIRGMLENRPDWCISRQRVWGVPIPALHCTQCGEDILHKDVVFRLAELAEQEGVDSWYVRPLADLVPDDLTCPKCGAGPDAMQKENDILDVWFESGSSFSAVLDKRLGWGPTCDLYLEGSDQHRGWFQHSLLIGIASHDAAPFKTVLTHGFVTDEQGHKYSKSSKNFEKPEKIIKTLGAEVLRLWVAAVEYRGDITLSPEILRRMTDAYRRIRNTARFLLGNLADFDPARDAVPVEQMPPLDRWALDNLVLLTKRLHKAYREYEYHVVFHRLLEYCTVDLSQVYLDTLKDRLYLEQLDDPRRRASQTVMYEIARNVAKLAAPILSFTADEIWSHLPHRDGDPESVHLSLFPKDDHSDWVDEDIRKEFELLLKIRGRVQEAIALMRPQTKNDRKEGQIGSSQEARVTLRADGDVRAFLDARIPLLEELFIVSSVSVEDGPLDDEGLPTVDIDIAPGDKCPRCWNYRTTFGLNGAHAEICERCAGVVDHINNSE